MFFSSKSIAFHISILASLPECLARRPYFNGFKHEAVEARRNQVLGKRSEPLILTAPFEPPSNTSSAASVLTVVTPSPSAAPVEVTQQSQVVTSYIPEFTVCIGPPVGLYATTTMGPPYRNQSTTLYGTTTAGTGSCSTIYATTETTVCATTLTGIASKVTISECFQDVTFSSEYGFALVTPTPVTVDSYTITPAPTVQTKITYYAAPWQSFTIGQPPTDVGTKVCTILDNGDLECQHFEEVWQVNVVTVTSTSTSTVDLTTTVPGPGMLIVETIHMDITAHYTSLSLSTLMLLETEIEIETTSRSTKPVETPTMTVTRPTVYETQTVLHAPSNGTDPTTTVSSTSTVTITAGTITRTRTRTRPIPTMLQQFA